MKQPERNVSWKMPLLVAGAGAILFRALMRRKRRIDFRGMSVVITGGSRGLGLELARHFAREGARLSLLARNGDELRRAAFELAPRGADVQTFICDVRDRREVEETVAAIIRRRGTIDVLINNAGIVQVAPFENLDTEDYREALDIYAWGPLHLVRAVVPHMQRRKQGRIVNISSIGGVVAVPHLVAYCMGKFALTALSDGIRAELASDGIRVTTVIPGLMRTGSHVNALFKGQHQKEFAWFAISGANPLVSASAPHAAKQIIEACRYGDPRLIITIPAKLLYLVNAIAPGLFAFGSRVAVRLLPRADRSHAAHTARTGWESASVAAPSILTRLSDRAIRPNNER